MNRGVRILACVTFALGAYAPGLLGQEAGTEAGDATAHYTEEQADRGEDTFQSVCSYCHADSQFSGTTFMRAWGGAPVAQLYQLVSSTMPYDAPGSMSRQQYADVIAYILSLNDLPSGEEELPADVESLEKLTIEAPPS